MAEALGLSLQAFIRRYVRQIGGRYSLKELHPSYDCVFLEGKRCRVYDTRPKQCRTYPFWPTITRSSATWKAEAAQCPGIRIED